MCLSLTEAAGSNNMPQMHSTANGESNPPYGVCDDERLRTCVWLQESWPCPVSSSRSKRRLLDVLTISSRKCVPFGSEPRCLRYQESGTWEFLTIQAFIRLVVANAT